MAVDFFLVPSVPLSIYVHTSLTTFFCLFVLCHSSVPEVFRKHSCMSFTFPIAILNGTCVFATRNGPFFDRCYVCQNLNISTLFLSFFVWFYFCCSQDEQVFEGTLVHKFHMCYSHAEWYLLFREAKWFLLGPKLRLLKTI